MNINQFMSILWARRWLALAVFLITVGATLVVSLALPKKYTASAAVVVEMKGDPIVGMLFQNMGAASYMGTQVDIFNSDRVARRVVTNLRLNENAKIRQQWLEETQGQGSFDAWLAGSLKGGLKVLPSRESSLVNVSYTARDPAFAAAMANGFVQAYLDTVLDLRVDPARQYSTFFDSRAKELRDQLEQAQSKLSAYQKQHGIIATDERLDIETSRLNELSSQLVALQAIASESSSRNAQAIGASGDRLQEVIGNPLISGIRGDLARAEARFQELTSRLGDAHPQVVEARANITELRSRLAQETRRVTGGVSVANTINRQREAEVRASLEAQRAKVLRMKEQRDEGSVLVKDVENAQRAYDQVLARRNQTTLESQTTQTNITSLTQAAPPVEPSSPRIFFNTLLSIVVGMMLAVGSVMLLEIVDRRVRIARDLTEALGLPMLGVLPRPARRRGLFGRPSTPLLAQRVLGQLPHPAKGT
jgi:chain length determinant protein EpsF